MILISHRGNINGRLESYENKPSYIDLAIEKGYDVEIDVWRKDNVLFLGHDSPDYRIDFTWFTDRISKLWIHCKNIEAMSFFNDNFKNHQFNYFWHETDMVALTSKNYIWAYPGKQPIENSISVMPEIYDDNISLSLGICSDVVEMYKFNFENS